MTDIHKERAFEDSIEKHLLAHGWLQGNKGDIGRDTALDPQHLFAFIQDTQPKLWEELRQQHQTGLEAAVLDVLLKTIENRGTLDVIRHGIKFFGKRVDLAYFKPSHGLNPDILQKYSKNRLVLTRQVKFDPGKEDSIDLVFSLNGIPVATAELKNPLTGQRVIHAIKQYQARDHRLKLLRYKKGALVHFAVDPDEVYMTTMLQGSSTHFLPFNRGFNNGAGNPPHPGGYKTAYLWEEVWDGDSFLDIVGRFICQIREERWVDGTKVEKEVTIFPRYHQLDSVRKLEAAARMDGAGKSCLVQHSAGSGKSNSIGWLAHRLADLHDEKDSRVFDSVVVITDRRILDQQLQDTIYQFEHKQGVVAKIDEHSTQLAEALKAATPIIITTMQKFPFVTEKIGQLPSRRYAVIVDEAHSSQTGEGARQMKEVLAAESLEAAAEEEEKEEPTYEDEILRVMQSRGRQPNLSFFAFTATPKAKTLEVFGTPGIDGKPVPFHLYSMRQAIEEGFILDVLANYTTYKTYYRLVKAIEDDPKVDKRKAAAALARFMSLHPHNIAQKTEVIVEHFRQKVKHKIGGKAKAMVVARSRLHAVRYKQAFDKYLAEKGYLDVKALVAFSGTVTDPETRLTFTEPEMNRGIPEKQLATKFAGTEYQLLLVAEKFQTGFDQPLLHSMYVDKKLAGVHAVQTLSRLNRTHPGKEDTFVLDFVNEAEEIQEAFQPYYEQTTISEKADPQQLYDLQHKLDDANVYWKSEVEAFCTIFFTPREKQTGQEQAEMYRHLNPAVDRFIALDEEHQDGFRSTLNAFVRLYAFLSEVMPFADADLEKRYTFTRFLRLKLPGDRQGSLKLDDEVALRYYRLQKISEGSISLTPGQAAAVRGATERGADRVAESPEGRLSEIIELLNEKFGTSFTNVDQLFFDQVTEEAKGDDEVIQRAKVNTFANFALSMKGKIQDTMIDRMDQNQEIVSKFLNEEEFRKTLSEELARKIWEELRSSMDAG